MIELTSKQRSVLRALASKIEVVGTVGKGGISQNQVISFNEALEKRELIKLTVLENCEDSAKDLSIVLAEKLDATVVCTIGRKIVLYKKSTRKDIKHIEF